MRKSLVSLLLIVCFLVSFAPINTNAADPIQNAITISPGNEFTDNLNSKNDIKYYKFTLNTDGFITFSFRHEYEEHDWQYWKATIYDSALEEYSSFVYTGSTAATKTSDRIGAKAGTYYIKVVYWNNFSSAKYSVKVDFTSSRNWETEFNDTFSSADQLSPNAEINGSLVVKNDADYYIITLSRKGYISYSFKHDYVDHDWQYWKVTLYDASCEEYTSSIYTGQTAAVKTSINIGVDAGTYYLKVAYYNNYSSVPYSLKLNYTIADDWETEFNDSFSQSNLLSLNTKKNGSLMIKKDADYYRFSLNNEGFVSYTFQHDYEENNWQFWKVVLYDSDCEEVSSTVYKGNETVVTSPSIRLARGNYYIKVAYYGNYSSAAYAITVNTEGSTAPTPTPTPTSTPKPTPTPTPTSTPTPPTPSTSFKDVEPGVWYSDYVAWAVQKGITNGTSATTFSPNADCTRAQIVTFLWRAAGEPTARGSNPFRDVRSDDYFYNAVLWAVSKGITNGTSNNTFSPNQGCTRAQVVTFFWRAAGSAAPRSGASSFRDVQNSSVYYYRAVLWAYENNVVNGTSEGVFSPDKICTRAEIVTILGRYYG